MQYAKFTNGGFVLHRVGIANRGRASAWYSAEGSLLDAEYASGHSVKATAARDYLSWLGQVLKGKVATEEPHGTAELSRGDM